ncbi:MAG: hypothetical protein ACFFBE_06040 [Promethearchaeota archaeon]
MDVEKFNKQLKSKIALAKSHEKRNEIDSAIKIWLEITEMTIKFSKSRNIDATFKNMLITRTTGIIGHIKKLKTGQIEKTLFEEDIFIQEEDIQEKIESETNDLEELKYQKIEAEEQPQTTLGSDYEAMEDSELKNLPKGFKEIQPKDFKIITPHDENYVEKRLSQDHNSTLFKQQKESLDEQDRFEFEKKENETLICFACGYDKNPKNAKTCKSCGTELN